MTALKLATDVRLPTRKQVRFQFAIYGMEASLQALQAKAGGPAAKTLADKHALLAKCESELRGFEAACAEYTAAGEQLSADEVESFRQSGRERCHPLLLQSPFARRCFEKPLGYAGDYGMVRYILGDPFQGESAFGQLVNYSLLQTEVAQGHRNRIRVLEELLTDYAAKAHAQGRKSRGLTIGCGPAEETFRFILNSPHADHLALTLLDFNQETLNWAEARLKRTCLEAQVSPELTYVQESVFNLAKKRPSTVQPEFDLVVCAGLFDYLTDKFCQRVIEFGARSLLPGGTLLVTNVSSCTSSFCMSEMLDWTLIYRSAEHLERLLPQLEGFTHKVYVDETGTNVVAELTRA